MPVLPVSAMTFWVVLLVLSCAFLVAAAACEWLTRRLSEEPPGYVDTSRRGGRG